MTRVRLMFRSVPLKKIVEIDAPEKGRGKVLYRFRDETEWYEAKRIFDALMASAHACRVSGEAADFALLRVRLVEAEGER